MIPGLVEDVRSDMTDRMNDNGTYIQPRMVKQMLISYQQG